MIHSTITIFELMNQLPGAHREQDKILAREALEQLYEMSNHLKCGLDKPTLASLTQLVEYGAKPEHVAMIAAELKKVAH